MRAPRTDWSENWRRRMPNSWQLSAKAERKPTTPRVGTSSCYVNLASQNYIKNRSVTNWISSNKIFDKDIFSWYCICLSIGVGLKTFFFQIWCGPIQELHVLLRMLSIVFMQNCRDFWEKMREEWQIWTKHGSKNWKKQGRLLGHMFSLSNLTLYFLFRRELERQHFTVFSQSILRYFPILFWLLTFCVGESWRKGCL